MATKVVMIREIKETFYQFEKALSYIDLTERKFFKWLDAFHTYPEICKAKRFIYSQLYNKLCAVGGVYSRLPEHEWVTLWKMTRTDCDILDLRFALSEVKKVWVKRPTIRRGSE